MELARCFPRVDTSEMRRFVSFVGSNEVRPRPKGRPLLWTFTDSHPGDAYLTDVWLQHGYATPLKRVVVEAEGSPRHTVYEDVQPGEAVKVDEVHRVYDGDTVLTVEVTVEREGEELLGFVLGGRKGRIPAEVLVHALLEEGGA